MIPFQKKKKNMSKTKTPKDRPCFDDDSKTDVNTDIGNTFAEIKKK